MTQVIGETPNLISSNPTSSKPFSPDLLFKYPPDSIYDLSKEQAANIPKLCLPPFFLFRSPELPFQQKSFSVEDSMELLSYTLTRENGQRLFLTALKFNQQYNDYQEGNENPFEDYQDINFLFTVCLVLLSEHPKFDQQSNCLQYLFHEVLKQQLLKNSSAKIEEGLEYYLWIYMEGSRKFQAMQFAPGKESLGELAHLGWKKDRYNPLFKEDDQSGFIFGIKRDDSSKSLGIDLSPWEESYSRTLSNFVVSTPLEQLLQRISVNSLVQLLHSLLLEKKLILVMDDISKVSLVMDGLLLLVEPLVSSSYSLIPNLKEQYLDYLDAPIPYIIGVSKYIWDHHMSLSRIRSLEIEGLAQVFYVDSDLFMVGELSVPQLYQAHYLKNNLKSLEKSLPQKTVLMQRMTIFQVFNNFLVKMLAQFLNFIEKKQGFEGYWFDQERFLESYESKYKDNDLKFFVEFFGTLIFNNSLGQIKESLLIQQLQVQKMKEFVYAQHNMIQKIAFQFQNQVQVLSQEECRQLYWQQKKLPTEQQSSSDKEIRISHIEKNMEERKKQKIVKNPHLTNNSRNLNMHSTKGSHTKHRSPEDQKRTKQVLIQKKNQQVLKASSQTRSKQLTITQRSKSKSSSSEDGRQFFMSKKASQEGLVKQVSEPVQASFVQAYESSRTSIGPKRLKSPGDNKTPSPPRMDFQNNSSQKSVKNMKPAFNQTQLLLKGKNFAQSPKMSRGMPARSPFQQPKEPKPPSDPKAKQPVNKLKSSFEHMPGHPPKLMPRKNKSQEKL